MEAAAGDPSRANLAALVFAGTQLHRSDRDTKTDKGKGKPTDTLWGRGGPIADLAGSGYADDDDAPD